MRIHLNLPNASSSASSPASTSSPSSLAPPELTALAPSGELILIELQGSLEIEHQDASGGQVLGTLSFENGREDRPILMVSHHRLEGRFVDLVKPLAVLEKKSRQQQGDSSRNVRKSGDLEASNVLSRIDDNVTTPGKRTAEAHDATPTKKSRTMKELVPSSPVPETPVKRPRRDALDFSSSPPYRLDDSPQAARTHSHAHSQEEEEQAQDEADDEEEENGREQGEERQTSVYYDVVNIIRRKILFSKRPEPIVKLDTESTPTKLRP